MLKAIWNSELPDDIYSCYYKAVVELNPKNIDNKWKLFYALFHESIHYITDKLPFLRLFDYIIDEVTEILTEQHCYEWGEILSKEHLGEVFVGNGKERSRTSATEFS